MSLDLDRLEKVRYRGSKLVCRCPACAEIGSDKSGEHLLVADEGRGPFGCVMYPGAAGALHRQRIWELAGARRDGVFPRFLAPPPVPIKPVRGKPRLPVLRPLNEAEMAAVAKLRGWPSIAGLQRLTQRGLLWFGWTWDGGRNHASWLITDSARRNAQARRLDGQLWSCGKAKSLPGSAASWPIGTVDIGDRPAVGLTEGQPDFCAALGVNWIEGADVDEVAPVCMAGAGHALPADALPYFAGKSVFIAVHNDAQGQAAANRWARQLYAAGAKQVTGVSFAGLNRPDGHEIGDLAEFAMLPASSGVESAPEEEPLQNPVQAPFQGRETSPL